MHIRIDLNQDRMREVPDALVECLDGARRKARVA
jgi:hypothetical protein